MDEFEPKLCATFTVLALVGLYMFSTAAAVAASTIAGIVLILVDRNNPSWTDIRSVSAGGVILLVQASIGGSVAALAAVTNFDEHSVAANALTLGALATAWSLILYAPFALGIVGKEFRDYLNMFPPSLLRQGAVTAVVLGIGLVVAAATTRLGGKDHWLSPLLIACASGSLYTAWCSVDALLRPQVGVAVPSLYGENFQRSSPRTGLLIVVVSCVVVSLLYGLSVGDPLVWGFAGACGAAVLLSVTHLARNRSPR